MELIVALAILFVAVIPLAYSFLSDARLLRVGYERAVTMELVDGEMEILAAGDWSSYPDGSQNYPVPAHAAATLPPGRFQLTKAGKHLRLEWQPDAKCGLGVVAREITIK